MARIFFENFYFIVKNQNSSYLYLVQIWGILRFPQIPQNCLPEETFQVAKEEYIFLKSVQQFGGKRVCNEESDLRNSLEVHFWRNIFYKFICNCQKSKIPHICTDKIFKHSVDSSELSYLGNFSSGQRGIFFPQKCTTVLRKRGLVRGIWFEEFI